MSINTTHRIEINGQAIAEYSISSVDAPAKAETNKMAIIATLALALISEARGEDNGMTLLDSELALEYLARISCGEKLSIRERVAVER